MTRQDEIERVHAGGTHLVILGAGASIASTIRNPEKNGKKLPMMNNIIEVLGLQSILDQLPEEYQSLQNDFEKLYSKLVIEGGFPTVVSTFETEIRNYFEALELPDEPTIYDYLVLSLRPKDAIATFNWDPFLYKAYLRSGKLTQPPGIIHLHGCVALGYSSLDERAGPAGMYSKATEGYFEPTCLLYPVEKKDYNSDAYVKSQWQALEMELERAERVTIFGYRAPDSDIEALSIMQKAWGTPDDRNMEQFELIDIREESEVKKSWEGFIHSHHYDYSKSFFESSITRHPRRSIESYRHWSQPLSTDGVFQDGNKIPDNFSSFDEMHKWYQPLIDAETKFYKELETKKDSS